MKRYIKPGIAVTEIELEAMIAASPGKTLDNTNIIKNPTDFESKKHNNGMTSLWDFDADELEEENE